jgi:hypothetical protein
VIRKFRDKHVFEGIQLEADNQEEVTAFLMARKAVVCAGPAPCLYAPDKWMVAWRNKGEDADCTAFQGDFIVKGYKRCTTLSEGFLFKYYEEVGRGVRALKEVSGDA